MEILTREKQLRRLSNLRYAESSVKKCTKRVRINNYLPGQAIYHLTDYPAKGLMRPTEYDYNRIKELSENGVELIQLHEDWNDALRLYGADKFSCYDTDGLREFIDLCHKFNIKILPYISTGFFDERDIDFIDAFDKCGQNLNNEAFRYRLCSLESPEWSSYVFEKVSRILDDYGFDGLYNDMGHDRCDIFGRVEMVERGETPEPVPYEPCAEDMLVRLYSLVKQKGGIMKHHYFMNECPTVKDKVYDYLWVGEAVTDAKQLKRTASYEPYVVPCPDFAYTEPDDFERFFAMFLPMMQFPLRTDGRPFNALNQFTVEGVDYFFTNRDEHFEKMIQHNKDYPNGPHFYSEWSPIPENEEYRERWYYYLGIYKKLVKENTVCHIDIQESTITKGNIPDDICISLFSGDEQYLCIANTGSRECEIALNDEWTDIENGEKQTVLKLGCNKVRFLKREN